MNSSLTTPVSVLRKIVLFPLTRLFIALIAVAVPVGALQALLKPLGIAPTLSLVLFTCLVIPLAYGVYAGYVRLVERRSPSELGMSKSGSELLLGISLGATLFTTTIGILWALGFYHVMGTNNWSVLVEATAVSVMSGFVEELIARGIIFRITEEALGTWAALAISSVFFGLAHLGNPHATLTSAVFIALEAGLLLGACYVYTRRLWLAVGLHLAWNFAQGGIFGVAVSGTNAKGLLRSTLTGPALLSGGEFGAEASLIAVVVCMTGFAFVFLKAVRKGNLIRPFWSRT